jgi:hypothetical protein
VYAMTFFVRVQLYDYDYDYDDGDGNGDYTDDCKSYS